MKTKSNLASLNWLHISTFFLLSTIIIAACDKVETPYLVKVENTDTMACPAPQFPEVSNHVKRVLLEDYTGHTCVNCPRAAVTARDIKQQYGDQVVLMAVHAGGFAEPQSSGNFTYDFLTAAGNAWDDEFKISAVGNPNGLVNRRKISNTFVIPPAGWSGAVATMALEAPQLDIQVINEYTPSEHKLCTHIQTQLLQTLDKNLKLIVALTEDSIVAPQKNLDIEVGPIPVIMDYVHMHVLRGTITSTWGSSIATSGISNPTIVTKSYRFELKDNWIPKNCRVVAFVYDADTFEVLQAAEAEVIGE
jgi:hypothetical protein